MRKNWDMMSPVAKVRRVVAIGLVLFGIWALSPYLYNRPVSEAFPSTSTAPAMADAAPTAIPAIADVAPTAIPAIADAAPTAIPAIADVAPTAIPAIADVAPTAVVVTEPVVLTKGSFIAGKIPGDRAEGTATIYRLADGKRVLRLEGFSTTNGPDLVIALHSGANPETDQGQYLVLAGLKGNQGDQNYELPADVDQSTYGSVVIWCRTFNIVFGYATLNDV